MSCPVCGEEDCHYNRLYLAQSWHPPVAERQQAIPREYLVPLWRCRPDRPGVGVIDLDPREACYVLANGCTLDGIRYSASFEGWDGIVQRDGRVTVRITPLELAPAEFIDAAATR